MPNKINTDEFKPRLREYLEKSGISFNDKKKPPVFQCISPGHADKNPSCVLYDESIYCPACGIKADIFNCAEILHSLPDFKEQLKNVKEVLGYESNIKKTKPKSKKSLKAIPVSVSFEEAQVLYNQEDIQKLGDFIKAGELKKAWPYTDKDNKIIAVDARFEKDNEKNVITVFYNGKNILMKNSPNLIFNLYEAITDLSKPLLIHEGSKCAAIGKEKLIKFTSISWNRGTNNYDKPDWSIFKDRKVIYFLRDDDNPGLLCAEGLKKILPQIIIIEPIPDVKTIKEKGADIEDLLQIRTPEEITGYILSHEKKNAAPPPPNGTNSDTEKTNGFPFRALGRADDGLGYFLDRFGNLFSTFMENLTQGKLLNLADLKFWKEHYLVKGKVDWTQCFCDIIEITGQRDFDPDKIRGRGAWREKDGRICFNMGKKIIGEFSDKRLYLKKIPIDIGLNENPLDKETCIDMGKCIMNLTFETSLDALRYMAWSILAPFAGALPWRPALLVTGPSESGKSTILDYVAQPLSGSTVWNGAETTAAFLRQSYGNDSCGIILEEAERDTKEKRKNVESLFSVMRQSTSDNAPKSGKGSASGKPISYSMKNMFMFIAISPEIENIADDNRIFRINLVKPKNDWSVVKKQLKELFTDENCKAIRALTWIKLKDILKAANKLTTIIQEVTGKSTRRSYSDALLFSAYLIIWYGYGSYERIDFEFAKDLISDFHEERPKEKEFEEADELLDRLLDETVMLANSKNKKTLRAMLMDVYHKTDLLEGEENKTTLAQYGLALVNTDQLAISPNHHEIARIIERGKGYNRLFWRHTNIIDQYRTVRVGGKQRSCVIIGNVLEKEHSENTKVEIKKDLFEEE